MNKTTMTAAMALLAVLTLSQVPLILGDNPTVSNVKFRFPTYDNVKISFSENITADAITITSENITFENLKMASSSYTASSQFFSVENADMTIKTIENENIEFDLDAPAATKSYAIVSGGGRGDDNITVSSNNVELTRYTWAGFQGVGNGWYYDSSTDMVHIKTVHSSTNSVSVIWSAAAGPPSGATLWKLPLLPLYISEPTGLEVTFEPVRPEFYTNENLVLMCAVRGSVQPVSDAEVWMSYYDPCWENYMGVFHSLQVTHLGGGVYKGVLSLEDVENVKLGGYLAHVRVTAAGETAVATTSFSVIEFEFIQPPEEVPEWIELLNRPEVIVAIVFAIIVAGIAVSIHFRSNNT